MQNALKDLLTGQLTDLLKTSIAGRTDTVAPVNQTAIQAALTALMTGLQSNVKDQAKAEQLTAALQKDHDGSVFNNVEAALANPAAQADGSKILAHIFGSKADSVAETSAKKSGVNKDAMIALMIALAPLVLGKLGEMKKADQLDADGVAKTVKKQEVPNKGLAGTLASMLDGNKDGSIVDDVVGMAKSMLGNKK